MRYARIINEKVVEILVLPKGVPIEQAIHPDMLLAFVEVDESVEEGWMVTGGELSPPSNPDPISLFDVKAALKHEVDTNAETERLKYITPGNGQAMTYQQKVTEAQAFKTATYPQTSDYPILSSEVGITAETLDDVANVVLAAFAQWQQIGAMIESIRLGAKRDIDAAEDEAAARAIVDAIIWPSQI